ncbi:MAG: carbohydrate-binding domain-containing protein [Prevotella sp.]|nr:carbohydrate-binding domain-containing protein [Prevotella sp.]
MLCNLVKTAVTLGLVTIIAGCSTDESNELIDFGPVSNSGGMPGASSNNGISGSGELFDFDVAFDYSALSEDEAADASDEDFIENTSFSETVSIAFSEGNVSCGDLPDGVAATVDGAKITIDASTSKNIIYQLSGSASDGMFKLYSDKKCAVSLAGLDLTNSDGPAINIQTKKRVFIDISDGSTNTLADGLTYADTGDEDAKGTVFSEGQLVFSGGGRLDISANCKAGISSDQYLRFRRGNIINVSASEGNGVRGKDSIIVSGGVMNIDVSGEGNKGLKSDGPVIIAGGRTTIIDSADAYYDTDDAETKGPAGINCDGDFRMTGGEVNVKATGKGGKGITADGDMLLAGGKVRVITTGTKFTYGSSSSSFGPMGGFGNSSSSDDNDKSPKGIRCEGSMTISGGDIMSRTTGGEGSEAIESKSALTVSGGTIGAYAYDDAINSGDVMTISGGNILAVSSNNDGLDSNGNMYITGGETVAIGLGEDGVDVIERGTLAISGGTLLSLGNTMMTSPSSSASTQQFISKSVSGLTSGSAITLTNNSGTLFDYTMPLTMSRAYLILSLPQLEKGGEYTLTAGGAAQQITL